MDKKAPTFPIWPLLGLMAFAFAPSTAVMHKFLGWPGVAVYVVVAPLALAAGYRYFLPRFLARVAERHACWLALTTLAVLVVALLVIYPMASSGVYGPGSDNDDALNVASLELLHGRYPYYAETYMGFPITPMPGSLLLAIPFVLMGTSAYQNVFWLIVLFLAIRRRLGDGRPALALFWVLFGLAPTVLHQFTTGSDYIANSLFVLLFMWWLVDAAPWRDVPAWRKAILAVLLGVGLSSRPNFLLLLPLVFSFLWQQAGWKAAMAYAAVTCLSFAALTVPFYLYDPQGFSPLHAASKLGQFGSILPHSGVVIPAAMSVIALALAHPHLNNSLARLLRNCAVVQAFPVVSGVILSSIQGRAVSLDFFHFGIFFLFFGAVSAWLSLFAGRPAAPCAAAAAERQ